MLLSSGYALRLVERGILCSTYVSVFAPSHDLVKLLDNQMDQDR